jgi:hypothetical protein
VGANSRANINNKYFLLKYTKTIAFVIIQGFLGLSGQQFFFIK